MAQCSQHVAIPKEIMVAPKDVEVPTLDCVV